MRARVLLNTSPAQEPLPSYDKTMRYTLSLAPVTRYFRQPTQGPRIPAESLVLQCKESLCLSSMGLTRDTSLRTWVHQQQGLVLIHQKLIMKMVEESLQKNIRSYCCPHKPTVVFGDHVLKVESTSHFLQAIAALCKRPEFTSQHQHPHWAAQCCL